MKIKKMKKNLKITAKYACYFILSLMFQNSFAQNTQITPGNISTANRDYIMSIPASLFQSSDNTITFHNKGYECYFDNGTSSSFYYHAPILLTDSITVKEIEVVVRCKLGGTIKIEIIRQRPSIGGSTAPTIETVYGTTGFNFPGGGDNQLWTFHLPVSAGTAITSITGSLPVVLNPYPFSISGNFITSGINSYYLKVSQQENWFGDFRILGALIRYRK